MAQDEEQKNFNYSPLSLYFALALASTGAGENSKTQAELFDVLGVPHSFDSSTQAGTSAALLSTELHNLYQ
ncbi:MAG: serpin family protein, partial [Eubacteriales bacterium]|nr:serpin family protein [Eubacteriales bacterium]